MVAGLPGAGKTTLVAGEPQALDSDAVRVAWAPRLRGVPYPLWRPFVHAWHWAALWRALKRPEGVVVVRPFTNGQLRRAVLRRARPHHPAVHLVVADATPAQARAGQLARGRTVRERAMRRHERRWARAALAREPWTTITRRSRLDEATIDARPGAAHAACVLRSRMIGPASACLALVLGGCGADAAPPRTPPRPMPPAAQSTEAITAGSALTVNERTERSFERAADYCTTKLAGDPAPSASRIRNEVQDLVILERTDPESQMTFGDESLSTAITRVASALRPCEPALADELDVAAAALPEA